MTELADPLLSGAVLIGTSHYDTLGEIGAVHNNLVTLADVLQDDRFWGLPSGNCVVIENPETAAEMLDSATMAAHNAKDTLLLYYAGHGLVDPRRGELHLALTGSDPQRIYTAVPYDNVRDILLDSRADRRIVILDCCYSGRALGQLAISADAAVDAASTDGTYVLAASAENKAALARPGEKYTAFTGELLNIIQNGIPGHGQVLDLDSIYRQLRLAMKSKGLPVPQKRERNAAGQLPLIRNQARQTAVSRDIDDEAQETVVPAETIPLAERLVFASEMGSPDDGPFRIVSGAAPCHFVLTREGDRVRLRSLENGHGPFINGERVKEVLLGPEDYFDFYDSRYQVSTDGSCLEVAPLFPAALIVYRLGAATGKQVRLTQMSFVLRERSLLAILGPSGAGKTTLFSALVGELRPESGELYLGALPLWTHGAQIRERLGFVPQDEALFQTFTVRQLLRYTYELRGAGSKATRDARVVEVCEQLEISAQINLLIGMLSGGQRKRVSIAAELLNRPSLLMLDEPTTGLDADMDLEILRMLRNYAEAGNTVIVTTHSTEHLRLANRVLVLASGGRPVYFGPPGQILKTLGATTYAGLMRKLVSDSGSLAAAYQRGSAVAEARAVAERMATKLSTADSSFTGRGLLVKVGLRQFGVLLRRQVAQIRARGSLNRSYKYHPVRWLTGILTIVAPLLIAGVGATLVGLVSGPDGLGRGHGIQGSTSAATTLTLLITLSMLTGQALTYSDIVNDYPTIRREHRTGTFTLPVVAAKWIVFAAIAVLQALLITWIYVVLRPPPTYSLFFGPVAGLFADLALMSIAAMTLGLLISAATQNLKQAFTLVTYLSIAQVALNGLLFNLSISRAMNIASMLLPYRWGLAAAASSINLRRISPSVDSDALWYHSVPQWGMDLATLAVLTAAYFLIAYKVLAGRLQRPD